MTKTLDPPSMSNPGLLGFNCFFSLSWFLQVLGHGTNTVEKPTRGMSVGILGRNQAESWPFGTRSAMEGKASRTPSLREVGRRFRNSLSGSGPHSPERSKKLPRPQSPHGERAVPSGYGEKAAFSLRAHPKARERGLTASPAPRGKPRGRTCSGAARTRGGGSPTPSSPASRRCACPSFGHPRLPPARATSARTAAIRGGREPLTLWAAPSWLQGLGGRRKARAEKWASQSCRAPRKSSAAAAAQARSWKHCGGAGAGRQAGGEGALQADGAGPGRAPPPPNDLGTRAPRDPAVGTGLEKR